MNSVMIIHGIHQKTPSHNIVSKPELGYSERATLEHETEWHVPSFLFFMFLWAIAFSYVCAFVNGGIQQLFGGQFIQEVAVLGGVLYVLFFVRRLTKHLRVRKFQRQLAQMDLDANVIQEIRVSNSRHEVFRDAKGKIMFAAIDIGDGKLLFLEGNFYGSIQMEMIVRQLHELEDEETSLDDLWEAPVFPCADFVLTRFPNSGKIMDVKAVANDQTYLSTETEIAPAKFILNESEIVDGHFFRSLQVFRDQTEFREKVIKKMAW